MPPKNWIFSGSELTIPRSEGPEQDFSSIEIAQVTMQPPSNLAQAAQTGFAASSAYDAHRPSYSPEALSELLDHLEVAGVQGARIVDLAAGTGKFTEVLAARPENFEIIAVEPHDEMRQELERKKLNRVRVYKGMADSMPEVEDGSAAALVAAQVRKHWSLAVHSLTAGSHSTGMQKQLDNGHFTKTIRGLQTWRR